MSENNVPLNSSSDVDTEPYYMAALRSLKKDMDVLIRQLSEGDYASPDTFANNWAYLSRLSEGMNVYMTNPGVLDILVRVDLVLAADLLAVSRSVAIIENFMKCAARRAAHTNVQDDSRAGT